MVGPSFAVFNWNCWRYKYGIARSIWYRTYIPTAGPSYDWSNNYHTLGYDDSPDKHGTSPNWPPKVGQWRNGYKYSLLLLTLRFNHYTDSSKRAAE